MHKSRPFLFTLLVLLVLDLLVFFTEIPSSSKDLGNTCFEQETEEVLDGLCEAEERLEEESEFLCAGLLPQHQIQTNPSKSCAMQLLQPPADNASPLAVGWRLPLLI